MSAQATVEPAIFYPESDGRPMADNTKQFQWIVTVEGGIDALFRDDPNVFVAGDLLWYPVERRADICTAPDVLVVFGRPKGHRGSYQQWREDGIAPQVVFEITSPSNTWAEMVRKHRFYEHYGVEEYYLYDPDRLEISGWRRRDGALAEIEQMRGWTSPRLGVRFDIDSDTGELCLFRPDGERFATYVELATQVEQAQRQAEQERQRAEQERQRAERLAAQMRALGIEPTDG
jgi:Uma2 family endonuclease